MSIIEGAPGIGKTRLLDEAAAYASMRACTVRRAAAYRIERDRPFGLITAALGVSLEALVAGAYPLAGEVAPEHRSHVIADAAADQLEKLCTGKPLLLCLDDLQWADPSSLLVLHYLAPRVPALPIAIVLSRRAAPEPEGWVYVLQRIAAPPARRLALAPLDRDQALQLATELSPTPPDERLLIGVNRTGGNPLFIRELVAAASEHYRPHMNAQGSDQALPPSVKAAVLRRLADVSTDARDVLTSAAILGTTFRADELAAVAGRPIPSLVNVLFELRGADLVQDREGELAFRHDLVYDAIYDSIPADLRRSLHRHAADMLIERGVDDSRVAEQVVRGANPGDVQAVSWLERAARQAFKHDPRVAADLLDRAVNIAGARHPDRVRLLTAELEALILGGRFDPARSLGARLLAEALTTDHEMSIRLQMIALYSHSGAWDRAVEHIDHVLADRRLDTDPDLRARLAAQRVFHLAWQRPDDDLRRGVEQSLASAAASDDPVLISWAHIAAAGYYTSLGCFRRGAEHALIVGKQIDRFVAATGRGAPAMAVAPLLCADLFDEVEARLRHTTWASVREGSGWAPLFHSWRAFLAYWRGAWEEATVEAETALALAEETGGRLGVDVARELLGVMLVRGTHLSRARRHATGRTNELPHTAALLAEVTGRRTELRRLLRTEVLPALDESCLDIWHPQGAVWVRQFLAIGERNAAESVAATASTIAERANVASATAQATFCRGLLDDDPDALLAAVEGFRHSPLVVAVADCLAAAGASLLRRGDHETATSVLIEAAGMYERFGAAQDLRSVDARLRSVGVQRASSGARVRPKHGWSSLTRTEQAIAGYIEQGLIYQEIADVLVISRRTVETHVAHIFAKLDSTSRRQVADIVRRASDQGRDRSG